MIETPEVNTALKRLDQEVLVARERRIKRAFDASVKRKTMDPSTQTYDAFEPYLEEQIKLATMESEEKAALNPKKAERIELI